MSHDLSFKVNGESYSIRIDEPRLLLVHLLRDYLGLTGTHIGCVVGKCGACTVIVDGVTVKSCMIFALQLQGCEITTIEGLANGREIHPIQQAFLNNHALECGYCTPGMIMATFGLLKEVPKPSDAQIKRYMAGNICRCTGYVNIMNAIREAAASKETSVTRS